MKLYPLLLGRTKVPFGQFYGGLSGWEGLGALVRFVTDKRHFIWVPIHAYLLEHPKEGLVLVDAGICPKQAHQHSQYYRGLLRLILDDDEYAQEASEALPEQLKRLGFHCDDVRTVILTHLHEDHVGSLRDLKKAKVVVSQTEWNARRMKMFGFIPTFYEPSYACVEHWQRVGSDSGAFHTFDRNQDLFGDGSVRLLPTPGHTPGHLSAVIELGGIPALDYWRLSLYAAAPGDEAGPGGPLQQENGRRTGGFHQSDRRPQESSARAVACARSRPH